MTLTVVHNLPCFSQRAYVSATIAPNLFNVDGYSLIAEYLPCSVGHQVQSTYTYPPQLRRWDHGHPVT